MYKEVDQIIFKQLDSHSWGPTDAYANKDH